jgi:heme exporter protein D
MMPDLGKYWLEVSASYGVSLAILGGLVLLILRRSRQVRLQLAEMEARRTRREAADG